ncbi:unnamed protein product, partial [Mesorhabditis belari]|uniref:Uncharacterized protein n=1 Tax=Mesorhabditis belari TaxID=2138241 RepID=A0AAF3ECW7_9BILA
MIEHKTRFATTRPTTAPIPIGCRNFVESGGLGGSPLFSSPQGISSPTDCAITPPGVLTKFDILKTTTRMVSESSSHQAAPTPRVFPPIRTNSTLAHSPTTSSPSPIRTPQSSFPRMCCQRGEARNKLFCKTCTMQKLSFLARKAKILERLQIKKELLAKAEGLINKVYGDDLKVEEIEARVQSLKTQRDAMKANILERRKETENIRAVYTRRVGNLCDKIEAKSPSLENAVVRRDRTEASQNNEIATGRAKLARLRRELMLPLFCIFPVCEVKPIMNTSSDSKPSNADAWAVLQDMLPNGAHDAPIYQVRDAMCCLESQVCRSDLSEAIEKGTLSLPKQFQTQLAAFMFTVQLVTLLAQVNDIVLPHSMSMRDICVWERWSPDLLETDWFKLCHCVYTICLAYQMKPPEIQFLSPHHNLIQLALKVLNGPVETISPQNLDQKEITAAKERLRWRERDHLAEWDTLDDVDDEAF